MRLNRLWNTDNTNVQCVVMRDQIQHGPYIFIDLTNFRISYTHNVLHCTRKKINLNSCTYFEVTQNVIKRHIPMVMLVLLMVRIKKYIKCGVVSSGITFIQSLMKIQWAQNLLGWTWWYLKYIFLSAASKAD